MKAQAKPDQLRDFAQGALGQFINNGVIYSRSIEVDETKGTATIRAKGIGNLPWSRDEERPYLAIEGLIGDFDVAIDRARPAWRDRSEARRVGNGGVSKGRSRGSQEQ